VEWCDVFEHFVDRAFAERFVGRLSQFVDRGVEFVARVAGAQFVAPRIQLVP
jgi:hypothetical protein